VPVFVDVELDTFNIDPALVEAALSPRTQGAARGASARHAVRSARMLRWPRRGMPVIEDAACAIGSEIDWQGVWQRIGSRTATWRASPSTRASSCPPATAA
jgi:dTDP-4-amino-4,6-dideoxygalactose transaminase